MTDWIKATAEAVKTRYEESKRELERRQLDAQAIRAECPRLWKTLTAAVKEASEKFNAEFTQFPLSNPIQCFFSDRNEAEIKVRTQYSDVSESAVVLKISFLPDQNSVACLLTDPDGRVQEKPPSALYFKASNGGTVHLAIQRNGASPKLEAIEMGEAVRLLLQPIFLAAGV